MQINKIAENKYQIKIKEAIMTSDESGIEVEGKKFTGPGEYERKGIFVEGIRPDGEGAIFLLHIEDISICLLGNISKLLSNEAVKQLGDVDILFVPMGADNTLKPSDAEKTISTIDPRIVIPTHIESGSSLETLLGIPAEQLDSLKIKKAELPVEDRKLYVIS